MSDPLLAVAALPGVPAAVERARLAVDTARRHRVLRSRAQQVRTETALHGARASAALEGAEVTLEAMRSGAALEDAVHGPTVRGALRVATEVPALAATWPRAPRQVLARLHTVAGAGVVPPDALGRPRAGAPSSDPHGLGDAPGPEEVAARFEALAALVTGESRAPALVLAGIVHGELLVLRAFGWGDGLVARAAARLVLLTRGLDPDGLTAPEVGHAELADAYAAGLRAYATGTAVGVAEWLEHCADAVVLGAREATAVAEAMTRR